MNAPVESIQRGSHVPLRTVGAIAGLAIALGGMLGGSALGVVYADAMPVQGARGFVMPAASAPPPMLALPVTADEGAPEDDDGDGIDSSAASVNHEYDDVAGGELFPEPPTETRGTTTRRGRTGGASRGSLDSAFYRVQPGPVTGYREGRAFRFTVTIVDDKPVELHTAEAFERMRTAAGRAGVALRIISGFRTMEHQRALYAAFRAGRGNLAALPGHSNHQSGHALDLNVTGAGVLRWLERHGREFGFRRTVPTETWHWEHW